MFLGSNDSAWEEVKVAIGQDALCKVVDKGSCLDKEVAEHDVIFPPSKEVDVIWVNIGA